MWSTGVTERGEGRVGETRSQLWASTCKVMVRHISWDPQQEVGLWAWNPGLACNDLWLTPRCQGPEDQLPRDSWISELIAEESVPLDKSAQPPHHWARGGGVAPKVETPKGEDSNWERIC